MDARVEAFSCLISENSLRCEQGLPISDDLLAALLEDPARIFVGGGRGPISVRYEPVDVSWYEQPPLPDPLGRFASIAHEVSQEFVRRLSFDRNFCYRIHRFRLSSPDGWSSLIDSALAHEMQSEGIHVSNVGGFHSKTDLFQPGRFSDALYLRHRIAACVKQAAAADSAMVVMAGETPPPSPRLSVDESPAGWANVSRKGTLNILHNHADAVLATVFYAQVPPGEGGSLLLRLTPGTGNGFADPDEAIHVPRMWSVHQNSCQNAEKRCSSTQLGVVEYVEVHPEPGVLMVFPGWLPHSVTPHFNSEPRISFASNWDLPVNEL